MIFLGTPVSNQTGYYLRFVIILVSNLCTEVSFRWKKWVFEEAVLRALDSGGY